MDWQCLMLTFSIWERLPFWSLGQAQMLYESDDQQIQLPALIPSYFNIFSSLSRISIEINMINRIGALRLVIVNIKEGIFGPSYQVCFQANGEHPSMLHSYAGRLNCGQPCRT